MKLKQFDGVAIAPQDDAILYNAIIKENGVFKGMEITHLGANQLLVAAGTGIIKGRMFEQEEETIYCNLAASGTLKGRMYIHMDLSDIETPIKIMTVAAETLPDLTQEEDCNYTNGVYEIELCTYDVTDLAISNLVVTYKALENIVQILETWEEVNANTDAGYLASALLVKELNKNLGDFQSSFQAGCDTLVAACKTMGVTPASNSPADIASAIKKIVTSASGSYTNSRSSTHTINCGFKPSKVVLFNGNTGRRDVVIYDSRLSKTKVYAAYSNGGVALDNMVDGSYYPSLDLVLTSTGFTVGYAQAYEGDTMYWLAIK